MKSLLFVTILAVTACSTPKETKVREPSGTVKPGAPTRLEAQLSDGSAKLNLRFEGAGENVSVVISGIDGLKLTSPSEVISGATVGANEVKSLDVTFTGRGHVVVSVRGTFNGFTQSRVHTVRIGEGPLKDDGKIQVTDDGDTVKLMP